MKKLLASISLYSKRLIFFIGFILLYSLTQIDAFFSKKMLHRYQFLILGAELLLAGLLIWLLINRYRRQLKTHNPNHYGLQPFSKYNLIVLLIGAAVSVGIDPLFTLLGVSSTDNQTIIDQIVKTAPILMATTGILTAPIIEELILRGVFFNYFFNRDSTPFKVAAVFTSGLIFGLLHEPQFSLALLAYSATGWLLGTVYVLTKDLRYPIMIHMLNNVLAFLFP
ncbi:hypothetical protein FC83_GL001381 [Agrilactobacillus composti DSM 18527 = JCM 14202]|uniref:CAAX prenyl protease 2/Lysostaphin resistance protein A-like domain-containing protein n=1 Tax=Agrilactobacillus composti DSM 18527 = JCM 14202 TaxID=1423734 RepID=X0PEF4_9LACO|nr:CPBP family intramembrane glutamic endopeptidase [Agrilactobacillus composti]KRM30823.1 hypothetical protein FC83_GL001381 [Agrilactobacillus composti DSM 18527 = JCM 14202]GAF39823.1 membrane-bound protease, CAAX family [Agrilactobacillus composti DSM 18527 = JCM 14202]